MAVLVKEFIDFETSQLKADADPYNWSGAVGPSCSLKTSPAPPHGAYTLRIIQHKTNSYFRAPLYTYTSGTTCITCAYVRFGSSHFPPSTPVHDLLTMLDEFDRRYWHIDLTTQGNLEFKDRSGTLLDSLSIAPDVWFRIEVVWQPGNASASWAWYISSVGVAPVIRGSGGTADFGVPGSDIGLFLRGQGGLPDPSPMTTYHGGCYIIEGATDINDRVGGREGKTGDWHSIGSTNGKITKNSATPDCDETGSTSSLDNLDPGDTWDEAGDDNMSTDCVYTRAPGAAAKGGAVRVGAPASDPSDVVVAAKWLWHGKTNRTNGFKAVYGRYNVDNSPQYVVQSQTADSIVSQARYYRKIEDRRDSGQRPDPLYNDQFLIGLLNST